MSRATLWIARVLICLPIEVAKTLNAHVAKVVEL